MSMQNSLELSKLGKQTMIDYVSEIVADHYQCQFTERRGSFHDIFGTHNDHLFYVTAIDEETRALQSAYYADCNARYIIVRKLENIFYHVGMEIVNSDGKISKRIAKYMRTELEINLTGKQKGEVGNIVYLNSISTEYTVKMEQGESIEYMNEGDYGDDGSCFYDESYNAHHRYALAANDNAYVLKIRKNGNRYGRSWAARFDGKDDQTMYLPFNTYSHDSALTDRKSAMILKEAMPGFELVPLPKNFNYYTDLYFNPSGGRCMVTNDKQWTLDYLENGRLRFYMDVDEYRQGGGTCCYHCEEYYGEDVMYVACDEHVCEDCLGEHYVYCENCDEYTYMDDAYYSEHLQQYLCEDCYNWLHDNCENCGELFHDDELIDDHCPDCHSELFHFCEKCECHEPIATAYINLDNNELICEDCIDNFSIVDANIILLSQHIRIAQSTRDLQLSLAQIGV